MIGTGLFGGSNWQHIVAGTSIGVNGHSNIKSREDKKRWAGLPCAMILSENSGDCIETTPPKTQEPLISLQEFHCLP